ncbi:hypothetical protein ES702_07820 [subsurface metagenome]
MVNIKEIEEYEKLAGIKKKDKKLDEPFSESRIKFYGVSLKCQFDEKKERKWRPMKIGKEE